MLLYEFEGKILFKNCGINVPESQFITAHEELDSSPSTALRVRMTDGVVLKAQTLSGKRAQSGGIIKVDSQQAVSTSLKELFGKTINGEKVEKVLVEEIVEYEKEYYLSFSYDTSTRGPIMTFGEGGTGVEEKRAQSYPVDILKGFETPQDFPKELVDVANKLWQVFTKYDCELAEINPLVIGKASTSLSQYSLSESSSRSDAKVYALDAKVILDDDADFRREVKFPERNLFGRPPTEAEIEARKIDEGDHRGTAGSVYWDLDGDIAVIAAGGGGSIVNMDALLAYGGRPANYTEHSGNPPREKLKKLTKIVLSKPGLKGCWFVGGTANFTDIYETLMGFVEGLREIKPKPIYPIVIRRGGPRDKEAFEMLKEVGKKEGFDFHIYGRETPMTSTAKIMVDLAYGK
ncbi:acetate--CoA ligase family protein [Candidatus Microgenomates bacterium]|nr:acetate--CoA ligase family protein [Candidatus Microgenomates bacterium]